MNKKYFLYLYTLNFNNNHSQNNIIKIIGCIVGSATLIKIFHTLYKNNKDIDIDLLPELSEPENKSLNQNNAKIEIKKIGTTEIFASIVVTILVGYFYYQ